MNNQRDGYTNSIVQQTFSGNPENFSYLFHQGTSMATVHMSGVCALVIAQGTDSPDKVWQTLKSTVVEEYTSNWDENCDCGAGRWWTISNFGTCSAHSSAVLHGRDKDKITPMILKGGTRIM